MKCKLCETEMYPIYAYPHNIPEGIPFKVFYDHAWREVDLYICPKCGSVTGEMNVEQQRYSPTVIRIS